MATYRGILAGIGDKESEINVIQPEIDAALYNFMVQSNGIINGFGYELVGRQFNLKSGVIISNGYRCALLSNVVFDFSAINATTYIYAENIINENRFIVYDTTVKTQETSNKFLLYTISTSLQVTDNAASIRLPYILNSANSENLIANGIVASSATTPTAPVGHNTKRVANTEFVQNELAAQINSKSANINLLDGNGKIIGSISLKRKSKLVVGKVTITDYSAGTGGIKFTVPSGFEPNVATKIALVVKNLALGNAETIFMNLATNGNATYTTNVTTNQIWSDNYKYQCFGYETLA